MRINTKRLAGNLGVRRAQVRAAIRWLQRGYSVPYLAYYGRARTGGLTESALREIARYLEEQQRLEERKQSVIKHIEGQERLVEELRESIEKAEDAPQLEELFFPFKQAQETPADQAHAQGLGKLADAIWRNDPVAAHLQELLPTFVNPEKGLNSPEDVLAGVQHLLAERLAQVYQWRRIGRKALRESAVLVARKNAELAENEGREFRGYFDCRTPVRRVKGYELLALVRGERERLLTLEIEYDQDKVRTSLLNNLPVTDHPHLELIRSAAPEAIDYYLLPALLSELRRRLYQRAEEYAAKVMGDYLRRLALLRPMPGYRVLAIDPALRPGCRVAVLDESGYVLDCRILRLLDLVKSHRNAARKDRSADTHEQVVQRDEVAVAAGDKADSAAHENSSEQTLVSADYLAQGSSETQSLSDTGVISLSEVLNHPDVEQLCELVGKFEVQVIVIGNNNYCREVQVLLVELLNQRLPEVQYSIISELGAAQYAGSVLGKEELPNLDAGLRLAVSLGRRFQDMLAELTKVDIPSLAGHLNWYDISIRRAQETVRHTLESVVNYVGLDLNQASAAQLRYVAGLNEHLARNIVDYRKQHGPFRRREELLRVPGMTDMAYQQAAAFLRIPDGEEPLDATWLHPEQYGLARRLLERLGFEPEAMKDPYRRQALRQALSQAQLGQLAEEFQCSPVLLREIANHLAACGRDPRMISPRPILRRQWVKLEELRPGQLVPGIVARVTEFGAFVDIGAKETALLHKTRMGRTHFHTPREVIGVGEVRDFWIVQVDSAHHRIALSLEPPIARRRVRVRRRRRVEPEVARSTPPVVMQIQTPTLMSRPAASTEISALGQTTPTQPTTETVPTSLASPVEVGGIRPVQAPSIPTGSGTLGAQSAEALQPRAAQEEHPTSAPSSQAHDISPRRVRPTTVRPLSEADDGESMAELLSGKRELRTFAELKRFFDALQRKQGRREDAKSETPESSPSPSPATDGSDPSTAPP
ncbi:MAG: Tex-like N-terminal domain-containing protein [Gemmatales bacterium]|nr:helix-hairpin-helix domain-containing protein [Gemmatales bacterium]MDW7995493.1 Tex-like N-terminal domain-containing protein [Gemmatales bacterium]